jgi:CMP-2-keto-3-deoxyoctulosonic acid synthetase
MSICAACVDVVPVGVDTQADLERADRLLSDLK